MLGKKTVVNKKGSVRAVLCLPQAVHCFYRLFLMHEYNIAVKSIMKLSKFMDNGDVMQVIASAYYV